MAEEDDRAEVDALMTAIKNEVRSRAPYTNAGRSAVRAADWMDDIMNRVRIEAASRQADVSQNGSADAVRPPHRATPDRNSEAGRLLEIKSEYVLADFLPFVDVDFVEAAHLALLGRRAEPETRDGLVLRLRSGEVSRIEVLANIRWSAEGRATGVPVNGLLTPYLIQRARRLPLIRPLADWILALLRLPTLQYRLNTESELNALRNRIDTESGALAARVEAAERRLDDVVAEVRAFSVRGEADGQQLRAMLEDVQASARQSNEIRDRVDIGLKRLGDRIDSEVGALAVELKDARRLQAQMTEELENLEVRATELSTVYSQLRQQVATQRMSSNEVQRRFGLLLVEARRVPTSSVGEQLQRLDAQVSHRLDEMYADLEEHFRGSRDDIKVRAQHYLASVRLADAGSDEAPVLDVGCGRGEWLGLLREHGLQARGVDINEVFLADCREQGLNVVDSDALDYLRELPDASIGAITSMHLVEHLSSEDLVSLIDESLRVLRPGGVIALETPNPENMLVGSHYFYLDPTHRNPLPPALLKWLVEARGFTDVRVDRLTVNRGGDAHWEPVASNVAGAEQINQLVSLMRQAPDYAVIARKDSPHLT